MKVNPKYFSYENLPCKGCKKDLMAAFGMYMDPGPRRPMPNMGAAIEGWYNDSPGLEPATGMPKRLPTGIDMSIDTSKAEPRPITKRPEMPKRRFNPGNALLYGLAAFDAGLPNPYDMQQVVQPQMGYNPYPYGTGSQAIMEYGGYIHDENNTPMAKDGNWIQKAVNPKHKGYCTPMTKKTCTPRRKALAKTFKKHHGFHEDGGVISDNMSPFNPHEYKNGGTSRGGSDTVDLMEQWIPWLTGEYADGGPIKPSIVKDSENREYLKGNKKAKVLMTARDRDATEFTQPMGMISLDEYSANIPEPRYAPQNLSSPTNYSITSPQGTTYLPSYEAWNSMMQNVSPMMLSSQESADKKRASAAIKNRPMKNGGTNRGGSDTTDLLEQWIPWMTGEYKNGGTLSASKAKEMLKDGTAHGKKLTKKQKQYFGMVAAGKAAMGAELVDPDPGGNLKLGQSRFSFGQSQIDRDALLADRISEIVGNSYDPYNKEGRAVMDQIRTGWNNPQLLNEIGVRVKSLQADPSFGRMTPEQRISRLYETGATGTTGLDAFLRKTRSLGGNPAANWQRNFANRSRMMANGGVMYDDGGNVDTMWGGNTNLESYNPYDGGTIAFNGASHDNGGIGVAYNGNPIEVEGGEYASRDSDGNLNIYGNMNIPGTGTKFKSVAKAMANKEKRYDYLKSRGSELVNNSNPADKYEQLTFNSGRAMMSGGQMGHADIARKKETLSSLQRAMLDTAREFGMDPQAMSKGKMKKARGGASIPFYQDGGGNDPTRADRNRNPGNIKYGDFAKKYGARKDKDGFAVFPSLNSGLQAMKDLLKSKSYKDLSVKDAIHKWTDGQPYRYNLGDIAGKKVSDLSGDEFEKVIGTMRQGEGTKYGIRPSVPTTPSNTPTPAIPEPPPFTPYTLPDVPLTSTPQPGTPGTVEPPPLGKITVPPDVQRPSNIEPLHANQLMGEIFALATNKVEPVPAQRYEPQLYQPYQMSFQDRLNQNEQTFNAAARAIGATNPSALGALAAQKYAADSAAKADEFRTNQAIANDITNKNIALINDAQMKNLGIADTQMVRQSQARSKTRELNQMMVNSVAGKYAQNELENKRLAAYENLYDYRFVPTQDGGLKATYFGPNALFNFDPKAAAARQDMRTVSRYDQYGNLRGYSQYDDYDTREQQRLYDLEKKRRELPLMDIPKLDR